MFSDNHNLIKSSDIFYVYSVYFEVDNHYKILLTTKGIRNFKETQALIDCVSENLIHQHKNHIKIYKNDSYLLKSYPIYNIFLVDDELTIYFKIPNAEDNEVDFGKMYDWSVLLSDDPGFDGRVIHGSTLIGL